MLKIKQPLVECVAGTQKKLTSTFVVHVVIKDKRAPLDILRSTVGELSALVALQKIYRELPLDVDLNQVFGKITCQGIVCGVSIFGIYHPSGTNIRLSLV
tara:strand:- start:3384 stop:3683 length:300 start_codon:yes stop_codon:yes gene_type:complete